MLRFKMEFAQVVRKKLKTSNLDINGTIGL